MILNDLFKALFTLSRCTPRCVPADWSRRTGANRDESGRNSSAFIYFWQCYGPDPVWGKKWFGLRRCIPCVEALRCVPVRPETPRFFPENRRQNPGVTTAGYGSRTAKPRCFTVVYDYQWIFRETYNRNVLCKVQNSIYIQY